MGFLDAKQHVIDVSLTEEGRRRYATGELKFTFFSLHDDVVDYDPFIQASGSYSDSQLTDLIAAQIESTPVLEVPIITRRSVKSTGKHPLVPQSTIFTAKDGFSILPMSSVSPTGSSIETDQRSMTRSTVSYRRDNATSLLVHLDHVGDMKGSGPQEFIVEAFLSSSDGLVRQDERIDLKDRVSFGAFLVLKGGNR